MERDSQGLMIVVVLVSAALFLLDQYLLAIAIAFLGGMASGLS